MDGVRFGRQIRALRRRRRWRQDDLAEASGVSRGVVARIEQGFGDRVTVATLERVAQPLGARLTCRLDWHGEALDRLLDADHAAIVEQVVRILAADGWLYATEVSFSIFGERGSIDILAFHPVERIVLVIEVKSVMPAVQATFTTLDRKVRLPLDIARERGWVGRSVGRLLVVREDRTARRRVAEHEMTFRNALPDRSRAVRRWLARPTSVHPLAGLWFLTPDTQAVARQRVRRTDRGPKRGPADRS
ncbi:MAG TPA: helix-turn-helix domain-containing protein [Candidatus Limnocylindrales bacterium]|nr:helix-turn-helix domain-containing protein [Candidatus Limnocylindrales bacterium]